MFNNFINRQPDRGCKMLTIPTEQLGAYCFHDYSRAKNFVEGLVSYHLSMSVVRKTLANFGDVNDLSKIICMEDMMVNMMYRAGLAMAGTSPEHSEVHYRNTVLNHMLNGSMGGESVDSKSAMEAVQAFSDSLVGIGDLVEPFFNELVERVSGRFSRYEDKRVLVHCGFISPSVLVVSYMTVLNNEDLDRRYGA